MKGHARVALWFLLPNLLGFLAFTLVPVVVSLGGSFTTWSLKPSVPLHFIGLENYRELFGDGKFYFYLYNTFYLMLGIPFAVGGSLLFALMLHAKLDFRHRSARDRAFVLSLAVMIVAPATLWLLGLRNAAYVVFALGAIAALGARFGSVAYRTFFYLPYFTAGAATIILWTQLYNPNFGLVNQTLGGVARMVGLPAETLQPGWLTSTRSLLGFLPLPEGFNNGGFGLGAREAIILMGIWSAVGGNNMLLFLAGLSNISPEFYEAAEIDGASRWQQFRFITWPQLAPTTFFVVVMSVIGGLQGGFEQARLMTQGGPAGTTTTLSYYIYTQGFERLELGFGCAVAWTLFVLIFGLTLLNWRFGNKDLA